MTLTARETMQALLDGEIVYRRDDDNPGRIYEFKLSEKGEIVEWFNNNWVWSYIPLNDIEGVIEEYPLTFEQALRAMLDGKVVESEVSTILHRFCNGQFEFSATGVRWNFTENFREETQKSKWKVVE